MCHFVTCTKTIIVPEFTLLFIDNIVCLYSILYSIVFDCGPIFTSYFWKLLSKLRVSNQCLLTAFHPQTEGQNEHMNQMSNTFESITTISRMTGQCLSLLLSSLTIHIAFQFSVLYFTLAIGIILISLSILLPLRTSWSYY